MYEEEYKRILDLFANSKNVSLEVICHETIKFFETLRSRLETGSPEEKQEVMKMMNELSTKLLKEVKTIYEKTGLTEEAILTFAENPDNFTPEQWRMMQEAKEKMAAQAKELGKLLQEGKSSILHKPTPGEKKISKTHRDDWMKT